ncbi:hypothetical protein [Salidesulfovibrio brasiliensis]|uniref:hypothetical protein n=1 Tax=Salidesulfovibrio brasiliensis TaxID=221711 RepID=UPI0012EE74F4|nr:hypothetical protein [Salidesulfovibrio brasiliensis]
MMNQHDMEDLLVSLFDPLLTVAEKTDLLREHPVDFTWCLSDIDGPVVMDGVEVVFKSGEAFRLIIIPGGD